MLEQLFIPIVASVVVFLIVIVAAILVERNKGTQGRIQKITAQHSGMPNDDPVLDSLYGEEKSSALAKSMEGILRLMGTNIEKFRKESQIRFYRAGIMSHDAPVYFLFFKRIGFVVFFVLAFIIFKLPAETKSMMLVHYMLALLMVVMGVRGGELFLGNQEAKRKKLLQRSFPDALDLLLVCVESGLALDGALSRVCRELGRAYPEITEELNRTRLELTLLNDRTQALTNLAERTDLLSFRALTTTLLQSEKFGTSLTDTLRVLSEDYRNTRLMLAEEKAGRLPVLMTVPLIVLMMPALFLIILGPTIIKWMNLPPAG